MVDATDFATPESALSAATKIKIYGKVKGATGVNFVSSGTGSLTNDIQHVGASALGLYTIALANADLSDASAAWYDQYIVSLSATGAAYQALICEGVLAGGEVSNISAILSDVYSMLSDFQSDFQSRVTGVQATASDLVSQVWGHATAAALASRMLLTQSAASDAYSAALIIQSRLSDLDSRLVSDVSDIRSAIAAISGGFSASDLSDIRSAIAAGPAATVTASDISDIASAVAAILSSNLSDILSAAVQTNSRALVIQSQTSDIYSLLSDVSSDVVVMSGILSDTLSAIAAIPTNVVTGTCTTGGTTTSIVASSTSPASGVNDQFNGRIMIFDPATTTAALRGQATDITGYVHATKTFTVTALTTAPASGDSFKIF